MGIASSIGEQPIKGLVNAAAGARMTVAEALSNLVFARISELEVLQYIDSSLLLFLINRYTYLIFFLFS